MMANVVIQGEVTRDTNFLENITNRRDQKKKEKKKKSGNQNNVLPQQLDTVHNCNKNNNNSNAVNKNKGRKRRNIHNNNKYYDSKNSSKQLKLAEDMENKNSCMDKTNHISKSCIVNIDCDCDSSSTLKQKKKKDNNDTEENCSCMFNNQSNCACTDADKANNYKGINSDIDINSSHSSKRKRKKKKRRKKEKHSNARSFSVDKGVIYDTINSTENGSSAPISLDYSGQESSTRQVQQDWFSPLHCMLHVACSDKMKILEDKGIVPIRGKWATSEVDTLHKNMIDFLASHKVKDFRRLVIPRTKEDYLFRKQTQFVLEMCRGIQRTGKAINQKIFTQYSNFLKKGIFSVEEREKLLKLHKIHGNKWKHIGYLMGRYHMCLQNVHSFASKQWNRGSWTNEEDKLLIESVNIYLARGEQISWVNVSKFIGTRSNISCRSRWERYLKPHHQKEEDIIFNEEDEYKLVSTIYESNIDDEYLIDWNELATHFMGRVTPSWLKYKFGAICKEVPHSHKLEFVDLLDQLYDIYQEKKNVGEQGKCNIDKNTNIDDTLVDLSSNGESVCNEIIIID